MTRKYFFLTLFTVFMMSSISYLVILFNISDISGDECPLGNTLEPYEYSNRKESDIEVNTRFSWFRYVGSDGYYNPNGRLTWHYKNICYRKSTDTF